MVYPLVAPLVAFLDLGTNMQYVAGLYPTWISVVFGRWLKFLLQEFLDSLMFWRRKSRRFMPMPSKPNIRTASAVSSLSVPDITQMKILTTEMPP